MEADHAPKLRHCVDTFQAATGTSRVPVARQADVLCHLSTIRPYCDSSAKPVTTYLNAEYAALLDGYNVVRLPMPDQPRYPIRLRRLGAFDSDGRLVAVVMPMDLDADDVKPIASDSQ